MGTKEGGSVMMYRIEQKKADISSELMRRGARTMIPDGLISIEMVLQSLRLSSIPSSLRLSVIAQYSPDSLSLLGTIQLPHWEHGHLTERFRFGHIHGSKLLF